jgi:hypothetical protein
MGCECSPVLLIKGHTWHHHHADARSLSSVSKHLVGLVGYGGGQRGQRRMLALSESTILAGNRWWGAEGKVTRCGGLEVWGSHLWGTRMGECWRT